MIWEGGSRGGAESVERQRVGREWGRLPGTFPVPTGASRVLSRSLFSWIVS